MQKNQQEVDVKMPREGSIYSDDNCRVKTWKMIVWNRGKRNCQISIFKSDWINRKYWKEILVYHWVRCKRKGAHIFGALTGWNQSNEPLAKVRGAISGKPGSPFSASLCVLCGWAFWGRTITAEDAKVRRVVSVIRSHPRARWVLQEALINQNCQIKTSSALSRVRTSCTGIDRGLAWWKSRSHCYPAWATPSNLMRRSGGLRERFSSLGRKPSPEARSVSFIQPQSDRASAPCL